MSSIAPVPSTSSVSGNKSSRSRRKSDIYSCGESEDEYIPKMSIKKTTAVKTQTKKKQSALSRDKSLNVSIAVKQKTGVPQLPDIMEEDENDVQTPLPSKTSINAAAMKSLTTTATSKKRLTRDEQPSTEAPECPPKRARPNSKVNMLQSQKASKKRPHMELQDDEDEVQRSANGRKEEKVKRRKTDGEMEEDEDKSRKSKKAKSTSKTRGTSKSGAKRGKSAVTKTAYVSSFSSHLSTLTYF